MRIRNFYPFMNNYFKNNEVVLNNTSLVIDGHSLMHRMCQESNFCYHFGCECDIYLSYVKEALQKLQQAKVKCYLVFKGGDEPDDPALLQQPLDENERKIRDKFSNFEPLFAREVFKEALNEMSLDYATCIYTNKRECVALAQRLKSPVMSFDITYYFFGVEYIPFFTLQFNPSDNILRAKIFRVDELMNQFQLDNRQVAIYITIFDEYVLSKEFQDNLLRKLKLPLSYHCRHKSFLLWLSQKRTLALEIISDRISDDENNIIKSELERNIEMNIKVQEPGGLVTKYFIDNNCAINRCDQEWFAKGVLMNFIAIPYINVYLYGILKGSWSIEDLEAEDSMLLSAPIVRYAFDLLTNFNNNDLIFIGRANQIDNDESILLNEDGTIKLRSTIRKPDYEQSNVFENGWEDIGIYQLFEHFLRESIQVEVTALQKAPTECRLLIAALIYFARRKCVDVNKEVYAVLLSYVMLGVVDEVAGRDGTLDDHQCKIARDSMDEYFNITDEEVTRILDRKLLHPLVEFQHCLRQFNFLNTLCGSPLAPTIYSKTYNATFVYNVLYDIKQKYNGVGNNFLEDKLEHAITVLSFVKKLFNVYVGIKVTTV